MKTIIYGGESFQTSDAAADALLQFAARLATTEKAEVVAVPAIDATGAPIIVDLVIGPASELMAVVAISPYDDPDAGALVEDLRERGVAAGAPSDAAVASSDAGVSSFSDAQYDELG
ncbi:hypothetical protein BH09ACT1_BH09ACT1_20770 [soil metagenome]